MHFTTSDGKVLPENDIQEVIFELLEQLKEYDSLFPITIFWEVEFLEWFLNKRINKSHFLSNDDFTEEDLEQLEKLLNFLEL